MNVTGGCKEDERPPSLYECGPLPGRRARQGERTTLDGHPLNNNNNVPTGCKVPNAVCSNGRCACLGDFINHRNKTTGVLISCRPGKVPPSSSSSSSSSVAEVGQAVRDTSSSSKSGVATDFGEGDSRLFSWSDPSPVTHLMETVHRGGGDGSFSFSGDALSPSLDDFRRSDGHLTFESGVIDPALIGGGQREETRRRGLDMGIIAPNRLWLYAVITASCVLLVFFSIALYISWTRCKLSTS